MTSAETYIKSLMLNFKANHPISVVYTDDPNDTLALTKASIQGVIRPGTDKIYYWTARERWIDITAKDKTVAELIATPATVTLSQKQSKTPLQFVFSSRDELKASTPVFIVSLLSMQFKDDAMGILQELRDFDYLCRHGVNDKYRIVILANPSFKIPHDYENIFGTIRLQPPTKEELEKLYDDTFIKEYISKAVQSVFADTTDPDAFPKVIAKFEELKPYCVNTLTGMSERQVKLILYKAVSNAAEKVNNSLVKSIDYDKFKEFIYEKKFEEIAKTEVVSLLKPLPMSEVGGLTELKSWLGERQWAFTDDAKTSKVKAPKGMALIGPPGTGKTHLARATSSLLNFPCLKFDASRVFNKYVGESEARIKQTLDLVESMAPCVLFIDEIDKVFSGQASGQAGDSGATSRVFGTLLSWMQDTKAEVFVVVTANRIQNIPSEFLRKGRLDEIWYVSFPTKSERKEILDIHLAHFDKKLTKMDQVLEATEDFSAAELEAAVGEGVLKAAFTKKPFSQDFLLTEVKRITPSSVKFKDDIERMKSWASEHARYASAAEIKPKQAELATEI